jgi:hypothetical protein
MNKILLFVLLASIAFIPSAARAQEPAARSRASNALPATCTPGTDNAPADAMVIDNLYYVCTAKDKWTAVHGLNVDNSWTGNNRFCGPIPWADVSCFGARAVANGGPRATVNCVKGRPQITLASPNEFRLNDGVTIYGCGVTNTMGTPAGLTVTPSEPWGLADTRSAVAGPAGDSTYEYTVVARDIYGALTAPASPLTLKTGQASLGLVRVEITSLARTNDRVTIVTKDPNKLVAGALVDILPAHNQEFVGWYNVAKVDSSTQFELWTTPIDTRAQGWMAGDTAKDTGGSVAYYQENYLKWTGLPGAWEYYVCAKRPGDAALKLIGVTKPTGLLNHYTDAAFEDYGSPYMDGQVFPSYVTDAICSGSPTNDPLTTWVTGISADGLTYTLRDAPSQTMTRTSMVFDDAPGILRALNSTSYYHSDRSETNSYIGGAIFIPPAEYPYVINSYLPVPREATIWQSGKLMLNETISLASSDNWFGDWSSEGTPQFSWYSGAMVNVNTASPGVYSLGAGNSLRALTIADYHDNGGTLFVADNAAPGNFDYVNFLTGAGGGPKDYLGMGVVLCDTTGTIANYHFTKTVFSTGPDQVNDKSWTPSFWITPPQYNGNEAIEITMDRTFFNRRGIAGTGFAGFGSNWSYRQGGIIPYLTCESCGSYGNITLNDASQDTEGQPLEASLMINPDSGRTGPHITARNATGGVQNPLFQGVRPSLAEIDGVFLKPSAFQNRDVLLKLAGDTLFEYAPYTTTGKFASVMGAIYTVGTPMHGVGGYSWWFDLPAPTAVTAAVASGGKVPAGTWFYAVTAVGADSGETILSTPSNAVATSEGTQTVRLKWAPSIGAYSYNVWRCDATKKCIGPDGVVSLGTGPWLRVALHVAATNYSDASQISENFAPPAITGTGSTIINSSGAYAPFFEAPPITVSQLPAAATGNAGQIRRVTDSTKITSEGQHCEGGGPEAALAFSNGTVWKCF